MGASMLLLLAPLTLDAQIQRPARTGSPMVVHEGTMPVLTAVPYTPPADPAGFTAMAQSGKVLLAWKPVPGVTSYLLGGAGMGLYGQRVQGSSYSVPSLAPGAHEWTVASLDADGRAIHNGANWPRTGITLTPATAVSGRYRITIAGFQVMRETVDDPFDRDGKRDEVYAAAYWSVFDRKTRMSGGKGLARSRTYGDASRWPARVAAGRGSPSGGLKTNDTIPAGWNVQGPPPPAQDPMRFPVVVWEGSLTNDKELLVIRPTLWEEDADATTFDRWRQNSQNAGFPDYQGPDRLTGTLSSPFTGNLWFTTAKNIISHYLLSEPLSFGKDRPLGVNEHDNIFYWNDQYYVLTRENLESTLNAQRGMLTVWFYDRDKGTDPPLQGHYRMLLAIERIP